MHRRIYPTQFFLALILALTVCAPISGCVNGGSDIGNPESLDFASDDILLAFFVDQYAKSALPTDIQNKTFDDDFLPAAGDNNQDATEGDFSSTNIQETGVDEADVVKTDGRYIYVAGERQVAIVDTANADAIEYAGSIDVEGFVDDIYLFNKTLIILYTPDNGEGNPWIGDDDLIPMDIGIPYWIPVNAKIGILLSDITNPEKPVTLKDIQIDGFLVASRLTGGHLHVISRFLPDIPRIDVWYDGTDDDRTETINENKDILADLTLDDFIPSYHSFDEKGALTETGRLIETEDFLSPADPNGGSVISILSVDLSDLSKDLQSIGFISDVHEIYASTESLYLLSTSYDDIIAINAAVKETFFQTRIYQFDLSDTPLTYVAYGEVPGHILNQFSMGEYNQVLRIATTTGYVWDGSSQNHVFCLKRQKKTLEIIGKLENLAPGERIYSARFIGERGFLVTFVEIDPLFTLDLSDPENPIVAGELKIPGYSTYIHPIGDNHLLTIGKHAINDVDATWYQGLQISLFDISTFETPELISTKKIGARGSESEALYNHKALTFFKNNTRFALPVSLYEHLTPQPNPWDFGEPTFKGIYAYRISEQNTIEFLGRIPLDITMADIFYYPDWMRTIFIEDRIFAVNSESVKADPVLSIAEPFDSIDLTH